MNVRQAIDTAAAVGALRLTLVGRVQGIGLRPALARWAEQLGCAVKSNRWGRRCQGSASNGRQQSLAQNESEPRVIATMDFDRRL
jgi:hypothetical protein